MNKKAVIEKIVEKVLNTTLKDGKYLGQEGIFDPFLFVTHDTIVLNYINTHWSTEDKTKFLRWYGSLQQRRLYNRMTHKDHSTTKVGVQLPGDYSLAALRVLGIDPWQL